MKNHVLILILIATVGSTTLAAAQSAQEPLSRGDQAPRLADIMIAKQWRHIKLWFAGSQHNWDLAAYELAQMKASLADAALLYSNIPLSDVTNMLEPIQSIKKAIDSKDGKGFHEAFIEFTNKCNACHRDMGREFITVQVPTVSPFSDQSFAPSRKQ
jgi:hypothetical protein